MIAWLSRARKLSYEVDKRYKELLETRERLTSITPSYSGQPGMKDPHKLDALAEASIAYDKAVIDYHRALQEIRQKIETLTDPREVRVLSLYYLTGLTWPGVANALKLTVRQVMNIRAAALEHIGGNNG